MLLYYFKLLYSQYFSHYTKENSGSQLLASAAATPSAICRLPSARHPPMQIDKYLNNP